MPSCSAPNCRNRTERGFRMYRFPTAKDQRLDKWLQNMGRANWNPSGHSRLCEKHFEESQFENKRLDGKTKLKPNAIPTLFDAENLSILDDLPPQKSCKKIKKTKSKPELVSQEESQELIREIDLPASNQCSSCVSYRLGQTDQKTCDCSSNEDTIYNLCRCCMHETRDTKQISFDDNLLDVYTKVTSRKLQDWNDLPKIICQGCSMQLASINNFIQKCVDSDKKFNAMAEEFFTNGGEIKLEELADGEAIEVFKGHFLDNKPEINTPNVKNEKEDWIDPSSFLEATQAITTQNGPEKNKNIQETYTNKFKYQNSRITHPPLTCFTCKMKFKIGPLGKGRKNLLDHYKNSEGCKPQEFKCTECPTVCKSKSVLKQHMDVHATDLKYRCKLCGSGFKQASSLNRHYENKHNNEADPLLCEFCSKKFNILNALQDHIHKQHPDKLNISCNLCPKKFITKLGLKRHTRAIHPNGQPGNPEIKNRPNYKTKYILCNICGIKCSAGALQLHMNKHKGIKPFGCDHCSKKFYSKGELKSHINRYLGIRPFKCNQCTSAFADSSSLSKHLKTHTGEKPFECPLCHKCFGRKQYLVQHSRTHLGERPYLCPHCPKAFTSRYILLGHLKTHINNGFIVDN